MIVQQVLVVFFFQNSNSFEVWCAMETKCSRNISSCTDYHIHFFADNSTHNQVSKEQIIEHLEPYRNKKFHKENYWKNYQRWNFPLLCDGQQIILEPIMCPSFESKIKKKFLNFFFS